MFRSWRDGSIKITDGGNSSKMKKPARAVVGWMRTQWEINYMHSSGNIKALDSWHSHSAKERIEATTGLHKVILPFEAYGG